MEKFIRTAAVLGAALSFSLSAQDASAFLGRWDMTVTPSSGAPYPQWMELVQKDGQITGRVQPRGGAWKPILGAKTESGKIIVNISAATPRGPAVNWELMAASSGKLAGVEKRGETDGPSLIGLLAPKLDRPMPKKWAKAEPLFNGKDLTGWEPIGNVTNNKWIARDGELVNDNPEVPGQRGPGAATRR